MLTRPKTELVEFRSEATRILSEMRSNSTFLTVHHYINNYGEIADFSIAFHVNYMTAIRRAKTLLLDYLPKADHCIGRPFSIDHLQRAREELLESYSNTLTGYNPLATSADSYDGIIGKDKKSIPGIKLHRKQDVIHLWGFGLHKRILLTGTYPPDNRMPLTIAKQYIRRMTPLGRFVQFKLEAGKFQRFVVEGMTIKEKQVIRDSHDKLSKTIVNW